jgi:hypothetical protein
MQNLFGSLPDFFKNEEELQNTHERSDKNKNI